MASSRSVLNKAFFELGLDISVCMISPFGLRSWYDAPLQLTMGEDSTNISFKLVVMCTGDNSTFVLAESKY